MGGAGCRPLDALATGYVLCGDGNGHDLPLSMSVKTSAGSMLWTASSGVPLYNPRLSPKADRFCSEYGIVYSRSAAPIPPPGGTDSTGYRCRGWVDDSTVVLWSQGDLKLYAVELKTGEKTAFLTAYGIANFLGTSVAGSV